MPLPLPLPPTLAGKPFTIKQANAAGLTRRRSRGQDLQSPCHGVRTPASADITLLVRAQALALATGAVISHVRLVQDPDMSDEDLKVALQYDGGHHAAPAQCRSDIFRDEKARGLGWLVVVLTQWDLDICAPGGACARGLEPQAVTGSAPP